MAIDPAQFVGLVRGLVDMDSQQRGNHADEVTDVRTVLDAEQERCVAFVLAEIALWETDAAAREAQLHALAELDEWDGVPDQAIELIRSIDIATLVGSEVEYVEWLTRDRS
jgi:hypothetical protein